MAVNPMDVMKLGERYKIFQSQHPRVPAFVGDVAKNGIMEGSVIEVKVTTPEGREFITNLRVTREDLESVEILKNLKR